MKDRLIRIGLWTLFVIVLAAVVFGYYYVTTPAETFVVVPTDFPPGFSPEFTPDQLATYFLSAIDDVRITTNPASGIAPRLPGVNLGIQSASIIFNPYIPERVTGFPVFDQKFRGVSLNIIRQWAVSAKARHFLVLEVIGTTGGRYQLLALLHDRPDFSTRKHWTAPTSDDSCLGPQMCTTELAEEILAVQDPQVLVTFLSKKADASSFRKIASMYNSGAVSATLTREDYMIWGKALQAINEYDRAIIKFRKAVQPDGKFCPVYDQIGFTFLLKYEADMQADNLDRAETAYRSAIACDGKDAVAYSDLGNVLIRRWRAGNKTDEQLITNAIEQEEQALRVDPQRAEAAVNLGYVQYMRGQSQPALDYFRKISETFPDNAALFLNFGFLSYREYLRGRAELLQQAIDKTKHAWELDPRSYVAANNLAFMYFDINRFDDAVRLWRQAYQFRPEDSDILAGLALGLCQSHHVEEAVPYYQEAIRRDPQMSNAEYLHRSHFWSDKAVQGVSCLMTAQNSGT